MTWTAQIRGTGSRWAAVVWRFAEHPPPETLQRTCSHAHETQALALACARAWRDQLEQVGA